jgi:hypothetical protein
MSLQPRRGQRHDAVCLVLTLFLEEQIKQGSREAADEKQSIIGRLKEEQSGQRDLPMVRKVQH